MHCSVVTTGLPISQLAAIYDHWTVRGSTTNPDDEDSLLDEEGQDQYTFGIDPRSDEIAFLQKTVNLSPSTCTAVEHNGCYMEFDKTGLESLQDGYDFVVYLRQPQDFIFEKKVEIGQRIIWIDYKFEQGTGCYPTDGSGTEAIDRSKCISRSLIDTVQVLEEFATFLGVVPTEKVHLERQAMCAEAATFVEHAKQLHDKGIVAAAGGLRNGNNGFRVMIAGPIQVEWIRTLEELGFPLLHPPEQEGSAFHLINFEDWFINCTTPNDCADPSQTAYPVDFWLLDSRTYAPVQQIIDVAGGNSASAFPDPAMLAEQFSYFVYYDGSISYTNIRRFLEDVRLHSSGLERLHSSGGGMRECRRHI